MKRIGVTFLVMCLLLGLAASGAALDKSRLVVLPFSNRIPTSMQKPIKEAFEREHPDVNLIFENVANSKYWDTILLRGASGDLPDTWNSWTDRRISMLIENGLIMPLDPLMDKAEFDASPYPQMYFDCFRRGENRLLWAFPWWPGHRGIVHYNKDVFDERGIPYITRNTTWRQFKTMLGDLVALDAKENVQTYGCLTKYPMIDLAQVFGLQICDDMFNPTRAEFGYGAFLSVIEDFLNLADDGRMMPLPIFKALGGSKSKIFATGKATCLMTHMSRRGEFLTAPFDWDVELIPGPYGVYGGGNIEMGGWCISSTSECPDDAFEFARWLILSPISLEIRESRWNVNRDAIPYAPELQELYLKYAENRPPHNWRCIYEVKKHPRWWFSFANSQDFEQVFWGAIWDVLYYREPLESLADAGRECQEILDRLNADK